MVVKSLLSEYVAERGLRAEPTMLLSEDVIRERGSRVKGKTKVVFRSKPKPESYGEGTSRSTKKRVLTPGKVTRTYAGRKKRSDAGTKRGKD